MSSPKSPLDPFSDSNRDLVRSLTFIGDRVCPVKNLLGFKKGHGIPDRVNMSSHTFIAKLAEEELTADLNHMFKQLRTAFAFKRTQMQVVDAKDGTGTIATPSFSYSISVDQDQVIPANAVWRRTLESIKDSDCLFTDAFSVVFDGMFNTLQYRTDCPVDMERLIDGLEDLDDKRIEIEYDHDVTECNLTIEGIAANIQVTSRTLQVIHSLPKSPSYILRSFMAIQSALLGSKVVSMVPIDSL
jgi:hypothetical protein